MSGLSAEAEALLGEVQSMAAGDDAWRGMDVRSLLARLDRDLPAIEAAAHARGVAEERARWEAAPCECGHCYTGPSSPSDDRGGPEGEGGAYDG